MSPFVQQRFSAAAFVVILTLLHLHSSYKLMKTTCQGIHRATNHC